MTPFSSRRTLFSISRNSLEEKKTLFQKMYISVTSTLAVMTLSFGGTRCCTSTSQIGQSQHQYLRLIGTQHLTQAACSLICSRNNCHADCAKCCVRINRKCWCCDQPIGDVLITHCVSPKCSATTVEWRLTTYTCFEIIFLSF